MEQNYARIFNLPFTGKAWKTKKIAVLALMISLLVSPSFLKAQTGDSTVKSDVRMHNNLAEPVKEIPNYKNPSLHHYRVNLLTTGLVDVLGTAGNLYAIPNILHKKKDLTDQQLAALNPNDVPAFDRIALRQDPSKRNSYKTLSDYILPGVVLSGVVLALDDSIRKDWLRIFFMYYEAQALTFSMYNFSPIGPAFQNRVRPFVYYNYFEHDYRISGPNKNSFFSGHTANVAAASFFIAKVYTDYHPELKGKKWIFFGLAAIPPAVEGYIRIKAIEHFPTDVITGFAVGAAIGILVPQFHHFKKKDLQVGMSYLNGAPGINIRWKPSMAVHKMKNTFSQPVTLPMP